MGKKTIRISFGDNKRSITDANGRAWLFSVHESGKDTISAKISGVQPTEEEAKPFLVAVKLWGRKKAAQWGLGQGLRCHGATH